VAVAGVFGWPLAAFLLGAGCLAPALQSMISMAATDLLSENGLQALGGVLGFGFSLATLRWLSPSLCRAAWMRPILSEETLHEDSNIAPGP